METKRKDPMFNRKVSVGKRFYVVPLILVIAVIVLAALPSFSKSVQLRTLSDPDVLRILYLVLALAVVLFTFGLLGDSEALIRNCKRTRFEVATGRLRRRCGDLLLAVVMGPLTLPKPHSALT